jgi:glyoxylase-like metal-dependent hydrolase (beta-lactamase superfamily II)
MTRDSVAVDEPVPGLFRLEEPDGERFVCQFVVAGERGALIVDSGLPGSPARTILPLLEALPQRPAELTLLLTHPDSDHCGGTAELRAARPDLQTVAHAADCALLGDPERTISERYERFASSDGIALSAAARDRARSRLGPPFRVGRPLAAEMELDLGGVACHILHAPGHSAGHAAVWLPGQRAMIAGDAVMGSGIRKRDGSLLYAPQFLSPATYRRTIDRFGALGVDLLLCSHEPPMRGAAVEDFLAESGRAVDRLEGLTRDALARGADTLAGVCAAVHGAYGELPQGGAPDVASTVAGILAELASSGEVTVDEDARPRTFRLEAA